MAMVAKTNKVNSKNKVLLDAMWRWGPKNSCQATLDGPVWVESAAITSQFPAR